MWSPITEVKQESENLITFSVCTFFSYIFEVDSSIDWNSLPVSKHGMKVKVCHFCLKLESLHFQLYRIIRHSILYIFFCFLQIMCLNIYFDSSKLQTVWICMKYHTFLKLKLSPNVSHLHVSTCRLLSYFVYTYKNSFSIWMNNCNSHSMISYLKLTFKQFRFRKIINWILLFSDFLTKKLRFLYVFSIADKFQLCLCCAFQKRKFYTVPYMQLMNWFPPLKKSNCNLLTEKTCLSYMYMYM